MSSRKERRAEMFKARKAQRKAGFVNQTSQPQPPPVTEPAEPPTETIPTADAPSSPVAHPQPEEPTTTTTSTAACQQPQQPEQQSKPPISAARLAANQANARKSHGALTPETKLASSLNHTIHGLARHQNGNFRILESEDQAVFASFKQSFLDDHQPSTPTEIVLVNRMIESEWLAQRALRLQERFTDPETGIATSDQKFSLYVRYQTTHTRAFHKCLTDLQKLRAEKRKANLGVEAQRLKQEAQTIANARHVMRKNLHDLEVHMKDTDLLLAVCKYTDQLLDLKKKHANFATELEAEFEKRNIEMGQERVILAAA